MRPIPPVFIIQGLFRVISRRTCCLWFVRLSSSPGLFWGAILELPIELFVGLYGPTPPMPDFSLV